MLYFISRIPLDMEQSFMHSYISDIQIIRKCSNHSFQLTLAKKELNQKILNHENLKVYSSFIPLYNQKIKHNTINSVGCIKRNAITFNIVIKGQS
jgi:hypothetical protein